jgi:hypothetical protein
MDATPLRDADPARIAAIALTLALHGFLLLWLLRPVSPDPALARWTPAERERAERMEVALLPAAPTSAPAPPAPRRASPRTPLRAPPSAVASALEAVFTAEPDAAVLEAAPSVLDLRLPPDLRAPPRLAPADPLRRSVRLPGRDEAFVEGIVLRDRPTPQQVVNAIGAMFFGGGGDPCVDIRSRLADAREHDERMDLIHRERANRCR